MMQLIVIVNPIWANEVLFALQGKYGFKVRSVTPMPHGPNSLLIVFVTPASTAEQGIDALCQIEEELGEKLITY